MDAPDDPAVDDRPRAISLREAFPIWCRVAALSFGGPAGQIAVMHRMLVDEKRWISEERFLHALNYCMLLPGPEAQQLATYIGWLMHRAVGGLMAGVLFVLPGCLAILGLSTLYAQYRDVAIVAAVFFGLKPAVMAIVFEAVQRIGKRVLKNGATLTIAAAAFVAIFFFDVPFPAVIATAAAIGFVGGRAAPQYFAVGQGHGKAGGDSPSTRPTVAILHDDVQPSLYRAVVVSAICLILWFGPLVAIAVLFGRESTYWHEGIFFSKAAVVTFGGAYSVLAYVAQQAVERYGWLMPGEMLDGLGMAETTPGPLIMVVQFVGFLGAYRNPGPLDPLAAGVLGSLVTTWVTFVPCFYWIFLGAPYIERLRGNRLLGSALSAITAAVVGVILNLAVWFALHVLFASVVERRFAGVRVLVPEWTTLNIAAAAIAILACGLTFCWKRGMAVTLATCAAVGAMIYLAWPGAR